MAEPELATLFDGARRITVLTGAGISTDSGIPDFRGPNGLWTKDPAAQRYVDLDAYVADATIRAASWQRRLAHPAFSAEPNPGHLALADLSRQGRLRALLTQNIDGLHQRAGVPDQLVYELHGSLRQYECVECRDRGPIGDALDRVRGGDGDPRCMECGGILKSATIFFGQPLDADLFAAASEAVQDCELFVAVGTSLGVHPVASLAPLAVRSGRPLVIINAEPTPYDDLAVAVVREPISSALPKLLRAPVAAQDR